ncbi:MAG: hypothetical protein U0S12_14025 [Fimbriimonadales bacterium]
MKPFDVRWQAGSLALGMTGAGVCLAFGGVKALQGFGLGFGGAAFNLVVLALVVGALGDAYRRSAQPRRAGLMLGLAFLAKLPIYVALGMVALRLGDTAPPCFLAGVALVYSLLIGWAMSAPR